MECQICLCALHFIYQPSILISFYDRTLRFYGNGNASNVIKILLGSIKLLSYSLYKKKINKK